jgi:hypothetical protein
MAMKKIDLGKYGLNVAGNVRRLRGDTGYAELSRRLDDIGRPIPPLGLRHLEAGNRRVDVDDLIALGIALDVAPITLLLPADDGSETQEMLLLLMGGMRARATFAGEGTLSVKVEVKATDGDN